jgi:hypothetical protein
VGTVGREPRVPQHGERLGVTGDEGLPEIRNAQHRGDVAQRVIGGVRIGPECRVETGYPTVLLEQPFKTALRTDALSTR